MGFAPDTVKRMTLWEYEACLAAFLESKGLGPKEVPGEDQMAALEAMGERWNDEARDGGE